MQEIQGKAGKGGLGEWVRQLDRLLRGEATRLSSLKRGAIDISPDGMSLIILVLGLFYGACMGSYALFQHGGAGWVQVIATTGKVPVLFALTLLVTFPSLYVFNALVGSRLSLGSVFRLIVAALAVMLALLASFGPIVAFFSASTTSYPFMLLLNVVVFAVSGFLGLKFLLFTLQRLSLAAQDDAETEEPAPDFEVQGKTLEQLASAPLPAVPMKGAQMPGALERVKSGAFGGDVKTIFQVWIVVFGFVGAQMSWVLRPFLGAPHKPFLLFAARESNFFQAVWDALAHLMS